MAEGRDLSVGVGESITAELICETCEGKAAVSAVDIPHSPYQCTVLLCSACGKPGIDSIYPYRVLRDLAILAAFRNRPTFAGFNSLLTLFRGGVVAFTDAMNEDEQFTFGEVQDAAKRLESERGVGVV